MPYSGDYLIGLDMGTSSVGWAVTDMEYHILKQKGKALWGIRLFDAAQTAAARRVFRTNRRRNERKKQRIQWLQQLFDAEIAKADPAFFQRLKESKFTEEEKQGVEGKYTLFSEETLTDQTYYETYPTIYHLRKALLEENGPFDVRLVYLALHHIIKNRGHFLLETNVSEERESFSQAFHTLQEYLQEQYELDLTLPNAEAFAQHLKDRKRSITAKKKILKEDAGLTKADGMQNAIVDLLAGAKVKLAVLFQDDTLKNAEPGSLSLDMEWDEEALAAVLGEKMELLLAIKAVYDWAILDDILNGQEYLSQAKVQSYEKHKQDLALLKQTVKTELPEQYAEVFHAEREKLDNYAAYSGTGSYHCDDEKFRKYLNNLFKRSRRQPGGRDDPDGVGAGDVSAQTAEQAQQRDPKPGAPERTGGYSGQSSGISAVFDREGPGWDLRQPEDPGDFRFPYPVLCRPFEPNIAPRLGETLGRADFTLDI